MDWLCTHDSAEQRLHAAGSPSLMCGMHSVPLLRFSRPLLRFSRLDHDLHALGCPSADRLSHSTWSRSRPPRWTRCSTSWQEAVHKEGAAVHTCWPAEGSRLPRGHVTRLVQLFVAPYSGTRQAMCQPSAAIKGAGCGTRWCQSFKPRQREHSFYSNP